jgi:hypothetical protein
MSTICVPHSLASDFRVSSWISRRLSGLANQMSGLVDDQEPGAPLAQRTLDGSPERRQAVARRSTGAHQAS